MKRKRILFISAAVLAAAAALVSTYWFLTLNRSFSLPRAFPELNAEWLSAKTKKRNYTIC